MNHEIAMRWTAERARLGFSQADIARKLGVSRESVRKWENGLGIPNSEALAVAFHLGFDIQYVLTGVAAHRPTNAPDPISAVKVGSGVGVATGNSTIHLVQTTNHTTRITADVKPGVDHITDQQAAALLALVNDIVVAETTLKKKPTTHGAVWGALNHYCKVPKYRLIRLDQFDAARAYLYKWLGRLNSMASAPIKDGDNWRKRRYSYLKVNSKEPHDAQALQGFLNARNVESIADLSNDDLEAAYRYMTGRKKK